MSSSTNFLSVLNKTGTAGVQLLGVPGPMGYTGYTGTIGPIGPIGPLGLLGPVGSTGYTGIVGPIGPIGPVGVFPSTITVDTTFNSNVTIGANLSVTGITFAKSISEASNSQAVAAVNNIVYLDYKQNSIYYVSGTITANLTCYLANIPSRSDRTYTVSMIVPFSGVGPRFYANVLQLNSNDYAAGAYTPSSMYANGGLATVAPNSSSTYITQTISVMKSTTLGVAGPNIAFTTVNSMF